MNKLTILVVEDDVPVRNLITTTLEAHEYRYITAENGKSKAFAPYAIKRSIKIKMKKD